MCFPPQADRFWCLCWLRQFGGMDWIIFQSTTSIYTEITLDCTDTNHGRTDQTQVPCWGTQPISHSWLTGVSGPAPSTPLLNTLAFYKPPSFMLPHLCPFKGNARKGLFDADTQLAFSFLQVFILPLQKCRGFWTSYVSWTLMLVSWSLWTPSENYL